MLERIRIETSGESMSPVTRTRTFLNAHPLPPSPPFSYGRNLDFPGHGHSDHKSFDSPHVMVDYMFYVKTMVDHIRSETGVEKVSLVGHSMGSGVVSSSNLNIFLHLFTSHLTKPPKTTTLTIHYHS